MASLWQRLTGAVPEQRAAQPTIPSRSDAVVTANSALTLTAVYRAVQIIATPISKMPIDTYRYATGMDMRVENPVLVNKPDINSNRRDFLFQTVTSLALEGNAFWHKSFGSNGQVNNLTLLPASSVSIAYVNDQDILQGVYFSYKGGESFAKVSGRICCVFEFAASAMRCSMMAWMIASFARSRALIEVSTKSG